MNTLIVKTKRGDDQLALDLAAVNANRNHTTAVALRN